MSRTEMIELEPGVARANPVIHTFQNSWGSAAALWSALSVRYLGGSAAWALGATDNLWQLARGGALEWERNVLRITFDYHYIEKEHYHRAALDIQKCLNSLPWPAGDNHWPEIAALLETETGPAVGFLWTSCMEDLWNGWDEKDEPAHFADWDRAVSVYGVPQ